MGSLVIIISLLLYASYYSADATTNGPTTHYFDWKVQYANYTRLCNHTKQIITINGEYPGPTQYVREGDTLIVNVTNLVSENVTIHWHGVRQYMTTWADGVAYVTQCPIQTGKSYIHKFTIVDQRGTLLWHAHFSWLRATLHGAFIILPANGTRYPFSSPHHEMIIILGEWWNADVEQVINLALDEGAGYHISDALTINGQPGILYDCSQEGTQAYNVREGKEYMLRIINAAVNFEMFVAVANHSLTVVEADAEYLEPFTTDVIVIAPGQTTNAILTTNQNIGEYIISASVYSPSPQSLVPFPIIATTALLRYEGASNSLTNTSYSFLPLPTFPSVNDSSYAGYFARNQTRQSYKTGYYYYDIFEKPDEELFYTIGYSLLPCYPNKTCLGPNGDRIRASVNNVTLQLPRTSILEAYYNDISGVYDKNLPDNPPYVYNYTGINLEDKRPMEGTGVKILELNSNIQIILQDTANLFFESHPIHLHGQNFYIVGTGQGTYDPQKDPSNFNLVNPASRNTVSVPYGGWAAIRFKTTNPGVWFMHCHFDIHSSWGMAMVFIVKNENGTKLPPPPSDLPPC